MVKVDAVVFRSLDATNHPTESFNQLFYLERRSVRRSQVVGGARVRAGSGTGRTIKRHLCGTTLSGRRASTLAPWPLR